MAGVGVGWVDVAGLAARLLISVVPAAVGVSGAVFLLPVQVSVFGVPSPPSPRPTCCPISWPGRVRWFATGAVATARQRFVVAWSRSGPIRPGT